jgi:hypothetical protein
VTVIFVPPARGRKRRNCSSITAANSRSDIPACDVRLASRALETPLFGLFAHTHGQALSVRFFLMKSLRDLIPFS